MAVSFFHNHSVWFYCRLLCWEGCLFICSGLGFTPPSPQEMTFGSQGRRGWVWRSLTCRWKAQPLTLLQCLFCFWTFFFFSDSPPLSPLPPDYIASGCLNPAHSCANAVSTLSICLFVFLGFRLQSAILYKQNYPFMSYPFQRFLLVIVNGSICGACLLIIFPAP